MAELKKHISELNRRLKLQPLERDILLDISESIYRKFGERFHGLQEHLIFGSFRHKTLLPKCIDEHGDVDHLLCFNYENKNPSFYISKIKSFCAREIRGYAVNYDHPSIILNKGRVTIELVPAIKLKDGDYMIPKNKNSWIRTDPLKGEQYFLDENGDYSQCLRIIKYLGIINQKNIPPYVARDFVIAKINDYYKYREYSKRGRKFSDKLAFVVAAYFHRYGASNNEMPPLITRDRRGYEIDKNELKLRLPLPELCRCTTSRR